MTVVGAAEFLGQFHGFVENGTEGDLRALGQFIDPQAQDGQVHRGHLAQGAIQDGLQLTVQVLDPLWHAAQQFLEQVEVVDGIRQGLLLALEETKPLGDDLHPGRVIEEMAHDGRRLLAGHLPLVKGEHGIAPRLTTTA